MTFTLSSQTDPSKVFLVQCSELEGRLDPFCYIPELVALDKKLKLKTNYRLKDFAVSYAGGATPKKDIAENYATKENGVPFIRVQNLSVTGELQLDDLVYISRETHEKYLKRSQLKEHDLLIKITGVGRMAVASVVPSGFEGNINQHIVVIRTASKEISENIAAFLNLDSTEKLASKRATGGTRPALDYTALLSIPVMNSPIIHEKTKSAVLAKKQKEAEAERLLASIDDYLLAELGITLHPESTQENFFYTRASNIIGGRLDAFYHQVEFENIDIALQNSNFEINTLGSLAIDLKNGAEFRTYSDEGYRYLRVTDLSAHGISNKSMRFVNVPQIPERLKLNHDCILISRSGSLGLVNVVTDEIIGSILSSHIFKVELNTELVLPVYLESFLRSIIGQKQIFRKNNGGVIPELNQSALKSIKISTPPLPKQQEIAEHITALRHQAKQLQVEAKAGLEQAKAEIEAIILGNTQ